MASYTEIDNDKLHRAAQQTITAALETLDDPRSIEKRKFIYQDSPLTGDLKSDDYPLLWIEDLSVTDLDDSGQSDTINGGTEWVEITAQFMLHTKADSAEDKRYFDELSDNVYTLFKSLGKGERVKLGENKFAEATIDRNIRATDVLETGMRLIERDMQVTFEAQVTF